MYHFNISYLIKIKCFIFKVIFLVTHSLVLLFCHSSNIYNDSSLFWKYLDIVEEKKLGHKCGNDKINK